MECERTGLSLSIDILLRWSKEASERSGFSSRQRRDISIGVDVNDEGTPAECYVLDRPDMGTLPEYLHTPILLTPVCSRIRLSKIGRYISLINRDLLNRMHKQDIVRVCIGTQGLTQFFRTEVFSRQACDDQICLRGSVLYLLL